MFDAAQSENTLITWLIRIGGLVGIFVGFAMMLSILGVIADVVPFIGSIVRFGTGAVALVLTMLIGPLVIAIAWVAYRPLVAIGVLAAGVLLAAGIVYLRRGRQAVPAVGVAGQRRRAEWSGMAFPLCALRDCLRGSKSVSRRVQCQPTECT